MTKYQDLLDREIGTAPPSTVDVDGIVRRQRRLVSLQRAGTITSAGVLAAALVVGVGILQQAGGARSPDAAGSTGPSAPAVAANPRQDEAARLTTELQTLVAGLLPPDAQLLPFPADPSEPAGDPLVFVDRGTYFFAAAKIQDAAGTGSLQVRSGHLDSIYGAEVTCPDPAPLDVKVECTTQPRPDGSSVLVMTTTRGEYVRHFIVIQRTDGNNVAVEATNGLPEMQAQRPNPVLTKAQAIQLATQPGLMNTVG